MMIRAGFPAITLKGKTKMSAESLREDVWESARAYTLSGKVPRTTAPAAIVQFLPTEHGPMMIAPPPIHTCSVRAKCQHCIIEENLNAAEWPLTSSPMSTA